MIYAEASFIYSPLCVGTLLSEDTLLSEGTLLSEDPLLSEDTLSDTPGTLERGTQCHFLR
jgi:hypothetical protein